MGERLEQAKTQQQQQAGARWANKALATTAGRTEPSRAGPGGKAEAGPPPSLPPELRPSRRPRVAAAGTRNAAPAAAASSWSSSLWAWESCEVLGSGAYKTNPSGCLRFPPRRCWGLEVRSCCCRSSARSSSSRAPERGESADPEPPKVAAALGPRSAETPSGSAAHMQAASPITSRREEAERWRRRRLVIPVCIVRNGDGAFHHALAYRIWIRVAATATIFRAYTPSVPFAFQSHLVARLHF